MRFEEDLYDAMCAVFPRTTVRSISKAMGMSSGYWSSLSAQRRKVSNVALMKLYEHLEVRCIQLETASSSAQKVMAIQSLIAKEIAARFAKEAEPVDQVWSEVTAFATREREALTGGFGAMPFVMLRG